MYKHRRVLILHSPAVPSFPRNFIIVLLIDNLYNGLFSFLFNHYGMDGLWYCDGLRMDGWKDGMMVGCFGWLLDGHMVGWLDG